MLNRWPSSAPLPVGLVSVDNAFVSNFVFFWGGRVFSELPNEEFPTVTGRDVLLSLC